MKWGIRKKYEKRRSEGLAGKRVYQKDMDDKQRQKYASARIKKRGSMQAIADEDDKIEKLGRRMQTGMITGSVGAMTLFMISSHPASALGSMALAMMGMSVGSNYYGNSIKNARRNINEIKRQSGIADISTTYRPRG